MQEVPRVNQGYNEKWGIFMGMGMTSSGPDLNSVLYFDAHFSFIINEFKDLRKQGDRRGGVPCFATVVDAIQQAHFFCAGLNLT